ncbi:MAG TPA: PQQ-dependent sugar dehydrogenase [Polyangia bacterium]|nr:PQQ-dependent sugar dehydrogenase [Polyangia bacterium]
MPSDFVDELYGGGLNSPTAMEIAPDGRVFVCEQRGGIRVIKNGVTLATPFVTVTTDPNGERGALGIAFDPAFASNGFVYVYYTSPTPAVHNRVSRFTANGDVAVSGSETVIIELDNLNPTASNHNAGAIHFGLDGKLYVATGENGTWMNSQIMTNVLGKLLRINADGSIPSDNPFFTTATGKNRAIWALGLRNPFTFAVQPGTGRIFINDVGEMVWEEIDEGVAGANYGWPDTEGPTTDPRFRAPIHAYNHNTGALAITGGAFYNPTTVQFPSSYVGKYFFNESSGGLIRVLDPGNFSVSAFASGANWPVDIKVGNDGAVYYVARDTNSVRRIRFVGAAGQAPVISQHPASITRAVGQSATFTVSASGSQPLAYQWQRNGSDIAGATSTSYTIASVATSDDGAAFRVRVSNSLGTATSNSATLTVTTNQAPTVAITAPATGAMYSGGQTINFAGDGNDAEDGSLPPSAFEWAIVFHHDTHTHPFLDSIPGVKSGSFVIPDRGERSTNVWYRIHLTVHDSAGLVTTTFRDIVPRVANVTLQSSPPGLQLTMDGVPFTAPGTFAGVVGMIRAIGAPTPQTLNGSNFTFSAWSDNGAADHEIAIPATDTTYTASYGMGGSGGTRVFQINSGGGAVSPFAADQSFSGGNSFSASAAVSTAGVANAAPAAVYQSERYGNFSYTLGGLTAGAAYTVRLHFAEIFWTAAGQRRFNVSINGSQVLTNYDIFVAAGGALKAVVVDFPATASGSGQIVVQYTTVTDNAKASGIELLTAGAPPPPPPDAGADSGTDAAPDTAPPNQAPTVATAASANPNPVTGTTSALGVLGADDGGEGNLTYTWATTGTPPAPVSFSVNGTNAAKNTTATFSAAGSYSLRATIADQGGLTTTSSVTVTVSSGSGTKVFQINSGGGAVSPFSADQSFSGGTTFSAGAAVSTAGVANAAPAAVYQSERYGNFSYTLGGLTAGAAYTVRLHFAEIFWTAAGQRRFNVSINGSQVLANYDIIVAAGGALKAVVRDFSATANASGQIVVQYTTVTDNAKSSGIELIR